MWKQCVHVLGTIVLTGLLGFVVPLTFAGRVTAFGLLACLVGFFGAASCGMLVGRAHGVVPGMAAWGAFNLVVAAAWVWFVLCVVGARSQAAEASEGKARTGKGSAQSGS